MKSTLGNPGTFVRLFHYLHVQYSLSSTFLLGLTCTFRWTLPLKALLAFKRFIKVFLLGTAASESSRTLTHSIAHVGPLKISTNGWQGKLYVCFVCGMWLFVTLSHSLNEVQWPNRNHLRRLNTLLVLYIFEARNLDRKKRYYCEIYLNSILYAQTCCKIMNEILFWGEPFVFM